MNTSRRAGYRESENSANAFPAHEPSPFRPRGSSGDPSIVSLSMEDMQRLIDIERSAYMALSAMGTIPMPSKSITDAASALANALAQPALGG
jgi:hypothetical protein